MKESSGQRRAAGRRRPDQKSAAAQPEPLGPQEQLFRACMRGDRWQAARALDRGADPSGPLMAVPLKGRWRGRTQYRPNLLLHAVVSAGDVALTALLLSRGADPASTDPAGRTALHALAAAGRLDAKRTGRLARLLSAAGADVQQADRTGRSACHLAAAVGNTAALAALAQLGADCGRADGAGDTPLHLAVQSGGGQTALLALQLSPASLQRRNAAGLAPLSLASSPDTARVLLAAGAAVDVDTLLALLRQAPDAMPAALDSCVTTNSQPIDSTELEVSVDFAAFCGVTPSTEDRLLAAIVASGQHQLFKHDAVEPFLHAKWCRVRHLFYANLALCVALTLLVSGYCWTRLELPRSAAEVSLAVLVVPLAAATAAREIFQLLYDPTQYVRSLENWVEASLLVLIAVLLLGPRGDPTGTGDIGTSAPNSTAAGAAGGAGNWTANQTALAVLTSAGAVSSDQLPWLQHTVAWTLPAAWLGLTLMLGRFPNFGVYINMFVSAARKLALFVLLLTPLVIGFALSFHVLLGDPSGGGGGPFDSMPVSHITTTMMMVGEYNYDDVFLDSGFGVSACLLLALFIVVMSIMSVNLLIGLTVADTRGVFRAAKLQSLRHTAVQILQVEAVLRSVLLRALLPTRLLRRQQHHVAVLPLLRAPTGGDGCGGGAVPMCQFITERGEVALRVLAADQTDSAASELSPAVFRPNRPAERRTIYLRSERAGDGGGAVLVPSGLRTRGWMQRGLLKLLGRRRQQPADRQQERLLDALLAQLSRPHGVTAEELAVLARATGRPAETDTGPAETAAAAPDSPVPPLSATVSMPVSQPAASQQSRQQQQAAVEPITAATTRKDTSVDSTPIVADGRPSQVLAPPRAPPAQRTRKTADHQPTDSGAGAGAVPCRRPGRAERRRERWRKEAVAQRHATVALTQKLNTVLATVSGLSLKVDTVQRRLAATDALSDPPARNSYT